MAETCYEDVGEPCGKPVVGFAVGDHEVYPACEEHAWIIAIGAIKRRLDEDGELLYRITERGANNGD